MRLIRTAIAGIPGAAARSAGSATDQARNEGNGIRTARRATGSMAAEAAIREFRRQLDFK